MPGPARPPAWQPDARKRCAWCLGSALYVRYHDEEWGVPVHDDRTLFEFLILEGAQAGLSWSTILNKRANYRRAFDGFDPERIARYGARRKAVLLADAGIVRNRLKIEAAVQNARSALAVRERYGSLNAYLWRFVDGRPIRNRWRRVGQYRPAPRSPIPWQTTSGVQVFASSAPQFATLSCRRWGWRTITW